MDGRDRVGDGRTPTDAHSAERCADSDCPELGSNEPAHSSRERSEALLESRRHIGDTQDVAQIDENSRHVSLHCTLEHVVDQGGLAEPSRCVQDRVVSACDEPDQPLALLPRDAFFGQKCAGMHKGVSRWWQDP